MDIYSVGSFVL